MILPPPPTAEAVEVVRKETIGEPPQCTPLPDPLEGEVAIRVGDKITTDHIMPAGGYLKLRSNIPRYAQVVFECFNEDGKPTFAERAAALRDAGRPGIIVAGESYGQGSSREHAAICPMYLGIRMVLARSIERIHAANLVNFGILPLIFSSEEDYERLEPGDIVRVDNVHEQLSPEAPVQAQWRKADGRTGNIELVHTLTREDIDIVLKGGRLA
jgi:aconitate hydratase